MSTADRVRWDERHSAAGPDRPRPPDAVAGRTELVPIGGRALDIACGRGGVAVWLATRGMSVDALDVSPVALRAGRELARRHRVTDLVTFTPWDLDDGLPGDRTHDLVVCQRFRAPELDPQLMSALAPGGLLVVSVMSEVGARPGTHVAPAGELIERFRGTGIVILWHDERDGVAHVVARTALRPPRPP